ncbi:MAG TPA: DUF4199 domain-containing protein [Allosphingosinicella sp.]|nr:DUF4199 domain-containing protein [Allosphingosinicella sp.]
MRYALTYGSLAGLVILAIFMPALILLDQHSMAVGYAIMLVGLTLVFVGMKRFRDVEKGGVIKFMPAFLLGLGISLVATIIYVIGWDIYLRATDFRMLDDYFADEVRAYQASGMSGAELASATADMEGMRAQIHTNSLFRMAMIALEILPVGLIVSLISAALLRNASFMRAKA